MVATLRAVLLCLTLQFRPVSASSFLSRANENFEELTPEMEVSILQEIESVLGDSGQVDRDRLSHIVDVLSTTFKAMPKNQHGKIMHRAVRYLLHNYFVQRHAWFVRGIADLGEANKANDDNLTNGILQDKVDDFIQNAFEQRLGNDGLDLQSVALLVATFENLVHKETMMRLNATFAVMKVDPEGQLPVARVDEVIDTYFMGYIMGLNYSRVQGRHLQLIRSKVREVYPTWDTTVSFLRDVRARSGFHKSFFSRSDIVTVVEQIADEYGRWQDKECQTLKQQLLSIEDTTVGTNGSGRVRIPDFYGSALREGNWQFSESLEYLSNNGALDSSNPGNPKVVIPNYINSPSNCLASSKFYSVCCINECESLMDRIEHHFQTPYVSPEDMSDFIVTLPSSSVAAGRTLQLSLLTRLLEIAGTHGGVVPLHGRLFAQWMHHAYPRECPYPHLAGTVQPQTPHDYAKQKQVKPTVNKDQMAKILETSSSESPVHMHGDEITAWTHHEELYVSAPGSIVQSKQDKSRSWWACFRPLIYLTAAAAAATALVRRSVAGGKSAALACSLGGKDVFV